ncbi:hypothetical protein BT96DRAFT_300155, partial [Gymnopus androsaceus JB14]
MVSCRRQMLVNGCGTDFWNKFISNLLGCFTTAVSCLSDHLMFHSFSNFFGAAAAGTIRCATCCFKFGPDFPRSLVWNIDIFSSCRDGASSLYSTYEPVFLWGVVLYACHCNLQSSSVQKLSKLLTSQCGHMSPGRHFPWAQVF